MNRSWDDTCTFLEMCDARDDAICTKAGNITVFIFGLTFGADQKTKPVSEVETGFYYRCNKILHMLFDLLNEIAFWLCAY